MIRVKRKNTAWLAALALIITTALFAANVAIQVQFVLIALFAIAAVASMVEIGRERENLIDALKRAPIRQRVSPQAREAAERARGRGGFTSSDLMMLDVGLIAVQGSYEGIAMRRTRTISKDDDGVRPFVTLNVDPNEAERNAVVRFEIFNQHGEQAFVHEMRAYLREGEMNIMTDHQLPLAGNRDITGTGDWDLRVYLDGNLVGMHNFMLAPSMNERQRRLANDQADTYEEVYQIVDEVEQEVPPRLQDLLQGSGSGSSGGGVSYAAPRTSKSNSGSSSSTSSSDDSSRSRSRRSTTRRRR